jgi:16S rRNA (cytosine1402-N4)-methyltransferase
MSEFPDRPEQDYDAGHLPVLPEQVLEYLDPKPGQTVLDCTLGRGGHGALLIPKLGLTSGPGGRYIGLDVDAENAAFSRDRLGPIAEKAGVRLDIVQANFRDARAVLKQLGIQTPGAGAGVDGLLADLGFASNQMDDAERGLSFNEEGPLDMRLDPGSGVTAERLVNTLPENELADLIYEFGEERLSRRIARKIVEQREIEPITTTSGLAVLVRRSYPRPGNPRSPRSKGKGKGKAGGGSAKRGRRIDPATRTFMALRIAVNDELGALDGLLTDLPGLLNPGGRAAIISFHSLEDRRVKRAYQALRQDRDYTLLTRKPLTADEDETRDNPRSRSAKMRVVQKPTKLDG